MRPKAVLDASGAASAAIRPTRPAPPSASPPTRAPARKGAADPAGGSSAAPASSRPSTAAIGRSTPRRSETHPPIRRATVLPAATSTTAAVATAPPRPRASAATPTSTAATGPKVLPAKTTAKPVQSRGREIRSVREGAVEADPACDLGSEGEPARPARARRAVAAATAARAWLHPSAGTRALTTGASRIEGPAHRRHRPGQGEATAHAERQEAVAGDERGSRGMGEGGGLARDQQGERGRAQPAGREAVAEAPAQDGAETVAERGEGEDRPGQRRGPPLPEGVGRDRTPGEGEPEGQLERQHAGRDPDPVGPMRSVVGETAGPGRGAGRAEPPGLPPPRQLVTPRRRWRAPPPPRPRSGSRSGAPPRGCGPGRPGTRPGRPRPRRRRGRASRR